jgi:hypothetical protein
MSLSLRVDTLFLGTMFFLGRTGCCARLFLSKAGETCNAYLVPPAKVALLHCVHPFRKS